MQLPAPCKEGDVVVLRAMKAGDPFPLPSGLHGTVTALERWGDTEWNVRVSWDNGRTLGLVYPGDKFDVFPRGWDKVEGDLPALLRVQAE